MKRIDNFKSIVDKYDIIFFDTFGVIKTYQGLVPGIERTFEYLEAKGKEYYIVTNDASRSPVELAEAYHKYGLNVISADRIISSMRSRSSGEGPSRMRGILRVCMSTCKSFAKVVADSPRSIHFSKMRSGSMVEINRRAVSAVDAIIA